MMTRRMFWALFLALAAVPLTASVGYLPAAGSPTYATLGHQGNPESRGTFHPEVPLTGDINVSGAARYGFPTWVPNTATGFVRWTRAPNNEVRFIVVDTLHWLWTTNSPKVSHAAGTNGTPSDTEVMDFQATGDPSWNDYHYAMLDGGSPAHPISICDATRSETLYASRDPFWGWLVYYANTCPSTGPAPQPTPTPLPSECLSGLCLPACPMNCAPTPTPSPSPSPSPSATPCPSPGPYPPCAPCPPITPCPTVTPCHPMPQWVSDYAAWLVTHSGPNQLPTAQKFKAWVAAEKAYCAAGAP